MDAVINGRPAKYDSTALDLAWRTPKLPSKLCIGVVPEDPAYPVHPPIRRVLDSTIESLTRAGHKVIRLPHDPARGVEKGLLIAFQYYELGHEPGEDLAAILGEPLVKSVAANAHPFTNVSRLVPLETDPMHKLDRLDRLRAAYVAEWKRTWFDNGLDAILAPGADKTAVPHDTYGMMPYTCLFNLLDVSHMGNSFNSEGRRKLISIVPIMPRPHGRGFQTPGPRASQGDSGFHP
jgi:amidase